MRNIFLILFLSSFSFLFGQVEIRPFPTSENSVFWEVSGNGLKSPSAIYGTMHLMTKDNFVLSKKVVKSLKKSEVLLMELDVTRASTSMLDLITLKDGSFFDFFSISPSAFTSRPTAIVATSCCGFRPYLYSAPAS